MILKVEDLRVSFDTYAGTVQAVRGVNFHIEKGEIVGIVGESGCGKSVTAQSIMRLISHPKGRVVFLGDDLAQKSEREMQNIRGNAIGMIFQDPMTSLNPTMRVGQQIAEVLQRHKGLSKAEARQQTIAILSSVGIPDAETRVDQYPHEFSGGMRQRVMIGIAIACRPALLIADEPTTALDVTIQAQILDLMRRINNENGTSILLITHDMGVIAGMCDRVLVMYAGEIMESGTIDQLFKNPQHPYTKALLRSIPKLGKSHEERLEPIEGTPPNLLHPPKGCPFYPRCPWAMEICKTQDPPLESTVESHDVACWLYHPLASNRLKLFQEVPR